MAEVSAKEFRIGNLIRSASAWNDKKEPILFSDGWMEIDKIRHNGEIDCHTFPQYNGLYTLDENEYSGIPITDEILKKLPLEEYNKGLKWAFELCNWWIFKDSEGYNFSNSPSGDEPGGMSVVIKSLHQLQNLYFALTGKELIND